MDNYFMGLETDYAVAPGTPLLNHLPRLHIADREDQFPLPDLIPVLLRSGDGRSVQRRGRRADPPPDCTEYARRDDHGGFFRGAFDSRS